MATWYRTLAAAGALALLSACASIDTVKSAPKDAGEAHSFNANFERVKTAALDSIRDMNIEPSGTDDVADGYVIYIARAPHDASWGEVGRVIVEKNAAPPTVVHVDYRRRFPLQAQGAFYSFSDDLFTRMEASLRKSASN